MAAPTIRRATAEDAEACHDLVQRAYAVHLPRMSVRPAPMDADYTEVIAADEVWVAYAGGRLAGVLVLAPGADHVLVENVAVDPDHQGTGLGRRLLGLAEERAAALGLPVLRLFTHVTMVENQRLYERVGYVETRRSTEGPWSRVYFEKRL